MTTAWVHAFFLAAMLLMSVQLYRNWPSLVDRVVTPRDWEIGRWLALIGSWPLGVLVHESGHYAVATLFGIRVQSVELGILSGSVQTDAASPVQQWFISAGGILAVAVLASAAIILATRLSHLRPLLRQLLLGLGLIQLLAQLAISPVYSLDERTDWSVMYDFSAHPILAGAMLALHALGLGGVLIWWSRDGRWQVRAIRFGAEERIRSWKCALQSDPTNWTVRLQLAIVLTGLGSFAAATRVLGTPVFGRTSAKAYAVLAVISLRQHRWLDTVHVTTAGLQSSDLDALTEQSLWANRGLALVGAARPQKALNAFAHLEGSIVDDPLVRYSRGLAHVQTGDMSAGHRDLLAAASDLAPNSPFRNAVERRLNGTPEGWRDRLTLVGERIARPPAIEEIRAALDH